MITRLLFLLLLIFSTATWANGSQHPCSHEQAIKAEAEAENLNNANAIYQSYVHFGHCDDGAIAEGYSVSVVRLLTKNWGEFERLSQLTASNKKFERFVLRHINETMAREDQQIILSNVRDHCPQQAERLCNLIKKAAAR